MEKLLFPCFMLRTYAPLLKKSISIPVVVPNGMYPMDIYNILIKQQFEYPVPIEYHWMTSKGRILTGEEAAEFALENDLLDKKVDKLTTKDYQGAWRP